MNPVINCMPEADCLSVQIIYGYSFYFDYTYMNIYTYIQREIEREREREIEKGVLRHMRTFNKHISLRGIVSLHQYSGNRWPLMYF